MNDERVRKLIREELRKLLANVFHAAETDGNIPSVTSDPHAPGERTDEPWRVRSSLLPESSASEKSTETSGETDTGLTELSYLNRLRLKARRKRLRASSDKSTKTKPDLP